MNNFKRLQNIRDLANFKIAALLQAILEKSGKKLCSYNLDLTCFEISKHLGSIIRVMGNRIKVRSNHT